MTGNLLTSIHNQEMHKRQAQRSVAKIRTSPSVMIRSFFFPFLSQCTPVSLHFRLFLRISTSVKHSLVLSHSPWDFVFPVKVNVQDPKIRAGSVGESGLFKFFEELQLFSKVRWLCHDYCGDIISVDVGIRTSLYIFLVVLKSIKVVTVASLACFMSLNASKAFLKSVVKTASSLSERCTLANYAGRTRKDPGECFGNYGSTGRCAQALKCQACY
ncbi:uncharacterized protein [Physcomitrium patens]|uniref:Uncharacterized protein n=1 Tax=Physcomitrium patens TaxID=3218 RepID=A0A2K1IFS9_PHYPA|nr:uncharacterized protein LOC112276465 [Physcomitrium patens]PNR28128.1 hypothetical protein PHYPA_028720 [Physcomitrium patens]|eukprot:XP_024363598.1 uncharacterized protein LOC112276465 [Physcomitrella patens]